jgi:hypothetical protein
MLQPWIEQDGATTFGKKTGKICSSVSIMLIVVAPMMLGEMVNFQIVKLPKNKLDKLSL